jgi:hypothetical protein
MARSVTVAAVIDVKFNEDNNDVDNNGEDDELVRRRNRRAWGEGIFFVERSRNEKFPRDMKKETGK